MNSSECSTLVERQSTSLVGMDEDSSAVLLAEFPCGYAPVDGLHLRDDLHRKRSPEPQHARSTQAHLSAHHPRPSTRFDEPAGVLQNLLGLTLINRGSARRTVSTVKTGEYVVLLDLVVTHLVLAGASAGCLRITCSRPCSKPVVEALGGGNTTTLRTVVCSQCPSATPRPLRNRVPHRSAG